MRGGTRLPRIQVFGILPSTICPPWDARGISIGSVFLPTNLRDKYSSSHFIGEKTGIMLLPQGYTESVGASALIQAHTLSIPLLCLLDSRLWAAIMCFRVTSKSGWIPVLFRV